MGTATRIFVSVSRKSSHYDSAWSSPESVAHSALQVIKDNNLLLRDELPTPRLLAQERWQRIHIVFDIFNGTYDPKTAHLPGQNDLPVLTVYFTGRAGNAECKASTATASLAEEVNRQIRDFHNYHGNGSLPPFVVDHADGKIPTYPNPRTLIRVEQSTV